MAYCRECRFYDGTGCPAKGKMNGGSIQSCFVPMAGIPGDKHCKTCRFFDGAYCKSKGQKVNPGNSLSCHVPYI